MNSSNYRFTLDMHSAQSQISLPALLGDTGRTLYISFSDGGKPYIIADGCLAKLSIKRPTRTHLEEFCIIENNTTVVYPFSKNENTCAVAGIHNCDVTLYDLEGKMITSAKFTMVVNERVINRDDIDITDDDYTVVEAMIKAEASRHAAEAKREAAEAERVANEEERQKASETILAKAEETIAASETATVAATTATNAAEAAAESANTAAEKAQTAIEAESIATSSATQAKNSAEIAKAAAGTAFNLEPRVSRNEKRIANIEKGLVPDSFVTDSSVAYVKDVPADACPFAAVNTIGGMTRKCTNLFDKSKVVVGQALASDGGTYYTGDDKTFYSGAMPVIEGKSYAMQGVSWSCFYSNDASPSAGSAVGGLSGDTPRVAPVGAKFLRVTAPTASLDAIMINEGSTALPYEPYFEGLRSAPTTAVESVGANVWDEEWEVGYYNVNTGAFIAESGFFASKNKFRVLPNTTYSMTCSSQRRIVFYDINQNYISGIDYNSNPVITTPSDCYYMAFSLWSSYGVEYKNDIMINKGATALPYSPYTRNTLPIPEAVQALDGYGEGVNELAYNYIDYEKKQFVKRVGKVDLGTLAWQLANTAALITLNDMSLTPQWIASTMPSKIKQAAYDGTSPIFYLFFDDGAYTSFDQLREDLQGVMLYYELATPEVTDISDILPADNYIGVEGGGTLTFKNQFEFDVPSEVTYQIKEATV